jgi:hypothetical protein
MPHDVTSHAHIEQAEWGFKSEGGIHADRADASKQQTMTIILRWVRVNNS